MEIKESGLRIKDLISLALRSFKKNPQRMFLTSLGISIAVGMVFFLISLGYGLQHIVLGRLITGEESLFSLETFYPEETNLKITDKEIDKIKSFSETKTISEMVETSGEISTDDSSAYVLIKIVKPDYFRLSGTNIDLGRGFFSGKKGVVLTNLSLRLLNLPENQNSLGKNVDLMVNVPQNEVETKSEFLKNFKIEGIIIDEYSPPTVYISFEWLTYKLPKYDRIYVMAKRIDDVETLRDKLISMGLLVSSRLETIKQARQIMTAITVTLGVFGIVALIVSAIGMFNVMLINFLERIFEIGIMKALGASSKDVRNLFLTEAILVSLFGGLGGIILGFLGGEMVNLILNILAERLGGQPVKLFIYPIHFVIGVLFISILVGVIAGFFPARKAVQLSAREAFLAK